MEICPYFSFCSYIPFFSTQLTLSDFETELMTVIDCRHFTLSTCCMLLGWCGPVGGQHVAPASVCVCVCEIPETYLDTLRNAPGSEAIKLPPHRATEAPSAKRRRRKAAFLQTAAAFFADSGPYFCLCGVGTEGGRRLALPSWTDTSLVTSENAKV